MTYSESESDPELIEDTGEFGENSMRNIFDMHPKEQCRPLKTATDIPINDPLRTVKMEIKSLLISQGAMSNLDIATQYRHVYGYTLNPLKYGFGSICELLEAMMDICECHIDRQDNRTYTAITDEKHKDLEYLIGRQRSPISPFKRQNHQSCFTPMRRGGFVKPIDIPSPYRKTRTPWMNIDRVASTKVIGQFPCTPIQNKRTFDDAGPRCKDRCHVIAQMVREIGSKSPDEAETRCNIEYLKNYYYQQTGLSIWGKIMSIQDYAKAWDQPEYLEFWRIMTEGSKDDADELRFYMVVLTDPNKKYLAWSPLKDVFGVLSNEIRQSFRPLDSVHDIRCSSNNGPNPSSITNISLSSNSPSLSVLSIESHPNPDTEKISMLTHLEAVSTFIEKEVLSRDTRLGLAAFHNLLMLCRMIESHCKDVPIKDTIDNITQISKSISDYRKL